MVSDDGHLSNVSCLSPCCCLECCLARLTSPGLPGSSARPVAFERASLMPNFVHSHAGSGAVLDGLKDHAIAVGEFNQLIKLVLGCVGVDVEAQADLLEANRHTVGHAERAAQV